MSGFQETSLWLRTLAPQAEPSPSVEEARARLRETLLAFRRRVEPLANEVSRILPHYTDHSIAHIDALWDMASLIAGPEYPITPAEAFVLGGAFMLHDLGMGIAAYPEPSIENLRATTEFGDLVAHYQLPPASLTLEEAQQMALQETLRLRHSKQAEDLIEKQFSAGSESFYLLSDESLRSAYGRLMGRIASSHGRGLEDLLVPAFEEVIGAVLDFPDNWTIDPLKLACLLRAADAAHMDSRRAPLILRAYRQPTGESADHWAFQQRLAKPVLIGDRLRYSSPNEFTSTESAAWWMCYDAVAEVSRELRGVDAVLADTDRPRFDARSVVGADDPVRLSRHIRTEGWTPIDASLRVSQVQDIVKHLGGESLYGRDRFKAVRELVANASDATRARRLQFGGTDLAVWISLECNDGKWVLRVADRGVGMTAEEMVQNLVDFGSSRWESLENVQRYPKLLSSGFRSTGKFGIGFFSVFMLGSRVTVRSKPYGRGTGPTSVLDFTEGVSTRPLLRNALPAEELPYPGTEVAIQLAAEPKSDDGLLGLNVSRLGVDELVTLRLQELCALVDLDVLFRGPEDADYRRVVAGDEWRTMSAEALFDLLYASDANNPNYTEMYAAYRKLFIENLEDILDEDGRIVGRAALAAGLDELVSLDMWWWPSPQANIYVGGLYADSIREVMGVFVGDTLKADRNTAFPVAPLESLTAWLRSQAQRSATNPRATIASRLEAGQVSLSFGEVVNNLPCALVRDGEMQPPDLESWLASHHEVVMIPDFEILTFHDGEGGLTFIDRTKGMRLILPENAVVLRIYAYWLYPEEILKAPVDSRFSPHVLQGEHDWDPARFWERGRMWGAPGLILKAAGRAWGMDEVELGLDLQFRKRFSDADDRRVLIPTEDGRPPSRIEAYVLGRTT